MATEMDPEKIGQDLWEALNSRMKSARALAQSQEHVADAQEKEAQARETLDAAEQENTRRYRSAREAGWTAEDLERSGLPEPTTEPAPTLEPTTGRSTAVRDHRPEAAGEHGDAT